MRRAASGATASTGPGRARKIERAPEHQTPRQMVIAAEPLAGQATGALEPPRVLHCIHSLSGGGAERQLIILLNKLAAAGAPCAVFCVDSAGDRRLDGRIPVFRASSRRRWNWGLFADLDRVIAEFDPVLVHAWLPASMTIPALLAARRRRRVAVFSYRSRMHFHRPLALIEFACALACADAVVSNNPVQYSDLQYRALFRLKRGREIRNAVEAVPEARRRSAARDAGGSTRILYAGRLVGAKNVECLIDALALLGDGHDWRLQICGDGPLRDHLRARVAAQGLAERVALLGYRDDLPTLMGEADLLVAPSFYEGMPNVVLEALAAGLPSVLSDIVAHRALVGDAPCCAWFDPRDPDELARRLAALMEAPAQAAALAEAGRAVAARYSPELMGRSYAAFYGEICQARAPRSRAS
jgi:glycosyltransferase involved in cell wall biosynthesis